MIDDLDEALRQLLIRELPVRNGEVDIAFDLPRREWSARLSRPTLNLYLYDIRENVKLRQPSPMWVEEPRSNTTVVTQRRQPLRVDLFYMATTWATTPEDEHRLLTRTLLALTRFQCLPTELLPESLQDQPPIPLTVAQPNALDKPTDMWNVLDNQLRPSVPVVVTLALDPHRPITTPLITTRELRVEQTVVYQIGGLVRSRKQTPLEDLRLHLVERGLDLEVLPGGEFKINNLPAGTYTVEVRAQGRRTSRHTFAVPSPKYEIEV